MIVRRQTILRFCLLPGVVGAAVLGMIRPSHADPVRMELQDHGSGIYSLEGHFSIQATPYEAWKVLTDYENIAQFVTSLRKSKVTDSTTDRILLEQEALGKKLILSKQVNVLLQVTEMPYKRIDFEDVLLKDFAFYKGSWELLKEPPGVEVHYRLFCKRKFVVPNFIARDALRKGAEDLLSEVRAEILRRSKGGAS